MRPATSLADSVEKFSQRVAMAGAPSAKRPPMRTPTTQQAACSVAATSAVSARSTVASGQPRDLAIERGAEPEIECGGGDHHRGEEPNEPVGLGAEQAQVEGNGDEEHDEAQPGSRRVGRDVPRDGGHEAFRPTITRPSVIACAGLLDTLEPRVEAGGAQAVHDVGAVRAEGQDCSAGREGDRRDTPA